MALSQPEATQPGPADNADRSLSFSAVRLQKLPHLTDYLPELHPQPNPLNRNHFFHPVQGFYVSESDVVIRQIVYDLSSAFASYSDSSHDAYHRAGPRDRIFFDPAATRAAIVTCGGLCPGVNTVIRELVMGLWDLYGVRHIYGIKAGYRGFYSFDPVELNPKLVHGWHKRGGAVLGTSRGGFDLQKIVDAIEHHG